jgi:Tfp pilus assembly protein PilO
VNQYIAKLAALEWPKILGIGVLMAGLYWALLYNDGSSVTEAINQANTRLQTANRQLAETEKALADANRFETEVQNLARQFEKIVDFMPATVTAADLTTIVNKQVQLAGVRAASIKPKSEIVRVGFYETSRVELELEGSFAQIVTFLSYMSRVPRLLTFENTVVTQAQANKDNASSILTFKTTLVGYRYLKDAPVATDPAAAAAAGTAGTTNPPGAGTPQ